MSDDRHSMSRIRVALAMAAILAVATAGRSFAADSDALALIGKAGSIELTDADVRRMVTGLPDATRAQALASDATLEQLVRNELVRRLAIADARAKGFDRDPAVSAELERLRNEVVARLWLDRETRPAADYPSETEIEQAYDNLRQRAAGTSDYHLAQIFLSAADGAPPQQLTAALGKAVEVQGKLAGGDFAALARRYSEHADSAKAGGDLGMLPESRLLPEVRAALATMKPGDVAGPIKTAQGIHFVRLVDRKPAAIAPLADVRAAIVQALREQRSQELRQRYVAGLARESPPNVNELELGKLRARLK